MEVRLSGIGLSLWGSLSCTLLQLWQALPWKLLLGSISIYSSEHCTTMNPILQGRRQDERGLAPRLRPRSQGALGHCLGLPLPIAWTFVTLDS